MVTPRVTVWPCWTSCAAPLSLLAGCLWGGRMTLATSPTPSSCKNLYASSFVIATLLPGGVEAAAPTVWLLYAGARLHQVRLEQPGVQRANSGGFGVHPGLLQRRD